MCACDYKGQTIGRTPAEDDQKGLRYLYDRDWIREGLIDLPDWVKWVLLILAVASFIAGLAALAGTAAFFFVAALAFLFLAFLAFELDIDFPNFEFPSISAPSFSIDGPDIDLDICLFGCGPDEDDPASGRIRRTISREGVALSPSGISISNGKVVGNRVRLMGLAPLGTQTVRINGVTQPTQQLQEGVVYAGDLETPASGDFLIEYVDESGLVTTHSIHVLQADPAVSLLSAPSAVDASAPVHAEFLVSEVRGEAEASVSVALIDGDTILGFQEVVVPAGGSVPVSFDFTLEAPGTHQLAARLNDANPGDADSANNSASFTANVSAGMTEVEAPQFLKWSSAASPVQHLALFGDGTLLTGGHTNGIFRSFELHPTTGAFAPTPFAGLIQSIWLNPAEQDIYVGEGSDTRAFRKDGTLLWSSGLGCCSFFPVGIAAVDGSLAVVSRNFQLWVFAVETGALRGTIPLSNFRGMAALDGSVVYLAGNEGVLDKLSLVTAQREWSVSLTPSRGVAQTALGHPAVAADGSVLVSTGGDRFFPGFQPGSLTRVLPTGEVAWKVENNTVSAPVIGSGGLIFVGTQAPPIGAFSPGKVEAYTMGGTLVWSSTVPFLPGDLFIGNDRRVYAVGGGDILAFDQDTGTPRLAIHHAPATLEVLLQDGVLYGTSGGGVAAIQLPAGFAVNYEPTAPWPVVQHDNQRTSSLRR